MADAKTKDVSAGTLDVAENDAEGMSVLHEHSTYAPDPDDRSAENPPPGPTTIQTLGSAG